MQPCAESEPPDGEVEDPHVYAVSTPAVATAPKLCRDFVGGVLESLKLPHLMEAATLCTSELVTNVHRHGEGDVRLELTVEPAHVQVAVYDRSRRLPLPRHSEADDTGGRGLFLVAALSDTYGTTPLNADGKAVWFRLTHHGWE
jgi:anti-sigma regulatory factor (Ser/Thr protein kinase)